MMAHIIYRHPTLSEFCFYEIKKLKDKTFDLHGYYVMPDGVERVTLDEPLEFDYEGWERESGWRPSSENPSIFEFTEPATETPTVVKITPYNGEKEHWVELTDQKGRREYILTTDNDFIIILVGIAAATCIGALIIPRIHGKCQDICGAGNVKEMKIGVRWRKRFIPTCESRCVCK
jgi:hypothetical protein